MRAIGSFAACVRRGCGLALDGTEGRLSGPGDETRAEQVSPERQWVRAADPSARQTMRSQRGKRLTEHTAWLMSMWAAIVSGWPIATTELSVFLAT